MSTDRGTGREETVHIHSGVSLSQKKAQSHATPSNMSRPGTVCHAERSKSNTERQIAYGITYAWNLKQRAQWSSLAVQQLGLCFHSRGPDLTLGWGAKLPYAHGATTTATFFNLKKGLNEFIYKTDTVTDVENKAMVIGIGWRREKLGSWDWLIHTHTHIHIHIHIVDK